MPRNFFVRSVSFPFSVDCQFYFLVILFWLGKKTNKNECEFIPRSRECELMPRIKAKQSPSICQYLQALASTGKHWQALANIGKH